MLRSIVMLLGAALALAYIPGWTGSFVQTGWAVLSLVLPWTLWKGAQSTPFHLFGLVFLWFAAVSLLWSPSTLDGVMVLWQLTIFGLAFRWAPDLRPLLKGLALGLAASSALAVASLFGIRPVLQITVERPSGLFYNPIVLGSASALVLVGLASERLWFWMLPVLPGFILAGSRGAWLATAVALAAAVSGRLRWLVLATGLAGAALFFGLWLDPKDSVRLAIWSAVAEALTPLGHGAGSLTPVLVSTPSGVEHPVFAHNQFLTLLYQFGALSAVPIWIAFAALWRSHAKEWPILVAFLCLCLYFDPLAQPLLGFLGAVAAGRCLLSPDLARADLPIRGCLGHMEARQA